LRETESKLAESNQKLQATAEYMEKTSKLYNDLVDELSTELEANQIKISEMKDGVTVNLSQEILFPSGSATLNDSGIEVIKKVSGNLKNIPHQIIVAGFTDNVAIKGELAKIFPTNWELAGARAASVVRLLESEGVESEKLTAVSFGENHPVASNDDWKLRAQNRRIEIRLRPVD
jgi:chemotaxis protein MotB